MLSSSIFGSGSKAEMGVVVCVEKSKKENHNFLTQTLSHLLYEDGLFL